ncbi:hypothetical protein [Pseudomonas asplenii]|uniref:hypothetical protein n=1 Tax=Pseudomonas asplenii TaxID=53407 RepID=UPI0022344EBE|nr:hypothetical protein [Pseudomonas asplenii]UZE27114.1 hypothetical protein LOY63_17190 [Pseudomonas asplenii]
MTKAAWRDEQKEMKEPTLPTQSSQLVSPLRKFDPTGMVRIPDCQSILEVLRLIRQGGPQWGLRDVTLWFPAPADAWVLVYPLWETNAPYFDFMYTREEPPEKALASLLEQYPQCSIIDWSPGRLVCIEVLDENIETLADIIQGAVEAAWEERITIIEATYEQASRA